ncbi:MAG: hypothetical protein NZM04_02510 [Methylacidiphilales bacterium]|nr:hypothetical protein [Candidatus Methylacidiphilales bacterium]
MKYMPCFNLINRILSRSAYEDLPDGIYKIKDDLINEILSNKEEAFFVLSNLLSNDENLPLIYKALILIYIGATKMDEAEKVIDEYKYSKDSFIAYAANLAWYYMNRDEDSYNYLIAKLHVVCKNNNHDLLLLFKNVFLLDREIKLAVANLIENICKIDQYPLIDECIQLLEEMECSEHICRILLYVLDHKNAENIIIFKSHPLLCHGIFKVLKNMPQWEKVKLAESISRIDYFNLCEFLLDAYNESDEVLRLTILKNTSSIINKIRKSCINCIDYDKQEHNIFTLQRCGEISEVVFKHIERDVKDKLHSKSLIGLCGGDSAVKKLRVLLTNKKKLNSSFIKAILDTLDKNLVSDFVENALNHDVSLLNNIPDDDCYIFLMREGLIDMMLDYFVKSPKVRNRTLFCILMKYFMHKKDCQAMKMIVDHSYNINIINCNSIHKDILEIGSDFAWYYFMKIIERDNLKNFCLSLNNFICLYTPFLISQENRKILELLDHVIDLKIDKKKLFLAILLCNNDLSFELIYKFSQHFDFLLDDINLVNCHILNKEKIIKKLCDFLIKEKDEGKILSIIKITEMLDKNIKYNLIKQRDLSFYVIKLIDMMMYDKRYNSDETLLL